MSYRTILADLTTARGAPLCLAAAKSLAQRFDATVTCLHVAATPYVPTVWAGGASVYIAPELIEVQRQAAMAERQRVEAAFRESGAGMPAMVWQEAEGDPPALVVQASHAVDLVVTARDSDAPPVIAERLITMAGVPVMVLPPQAVATPGRSILVGWNASREAVRALHQALPFLAGAERVHLCAVGDEACAGLDAVMTMLRRHQVTAEAVPAASPDREAGTVLLAEAARLGADLVVMGSYGHARVRELILGGATRHALCHAELPILFGS